MRFLQFDYYLGMKMVSYRLQNTKIGHLERYHR